jgi:hypothetical protein
MRVDERCPGVRLDLLLRGPALLDRPQPLRDLLVERLGAILHWVRLAPLLSPDGQKWLRAAERAAQLARPVPYGNCYA